jgi:uncharacterized protein YbjT (DUF2867 family)
VTTASEISSAGHGQATSDVLLLGAAGNSGRPIAAELVARRLSVRLAGRRRGPLEDLAQALAADGATADVRTVDIGDAASLAEAMAGAGVVLSTIGPFVRQAGRRWVGARRSRHRAAGIGWRRPSAPGRWRSRDGCRNRC